MLEQGRHVDVGAWEQCGCGSVSKGAGEQCGGERVMRMWKPCGCVCDADAGAREQCGWGAIARE